MSAMLWCQAVRNGADGMHSERQRWLEMTRHIFHFLMSTYRYTRNASALAAPTYIPSAGRLNLLHLPGAGTHACTSSPSSCAGSGPSQLSAESLGGALNNLGTGSGGGAPAGGATGGSGGGDLGSSAGGDVGSSAGGDLGSSSISPRGTGRLGMGGASGSGLTRYSPGLSH